MMIFLENSGAAGQCSNKFNGINIIDESQGLYADAASRDAMPIMVRIILSD